MKRILLILGGAGLLLWTGLGLVAWSSVARNASTPRTAVAPDETRLLALQDEVGALQQDVRALAEALGENLESLSGVLLANQDEHAAQFELQMAALRGEADSRDASSPSDELAGLLAELRALRGVLDVPGEAAPPDPLVPPPTSPPTAAVEVAAETAPAPAASAPATPPAKKSFLAFKLPSDDFRFDERRTWTLLPALSRVGFDAKTTLHDFTATSSGVVGELEADLSRPGEAPRAHLKVQAATLDSADPGRDQEMRERLAVADHPTLEFELTSFVPETTDLAAQRATGTARGRMTIRGVTQDVEMPVRVSVDDARRLCVEGEMPLDLTRFHVPVPNKLGLISMEKEVQVWISLRLRAAPRTRTEG